MSNVTKYDVIVVGGGPAGSTCAANLVKAGVNTLLLDSNPFPRVKLCAGWLSAPVWDTLGISPHEYPHGLWQFDKAHIHLHGKTYHKKAHGYFIRRSQFDHFLLQRSRVQTMLDFHVTQIEKDEEGYWVINGKVRAKYLVGAGGTHCPVARALFPKRRNLPCGTQEKEFEAGAEEIAGTRVGKDGEPEILLHDDMKGYSWNIPKGSWLNVGTGTQVAREVLTAWSKSRAVFEGTGGQGTIPVSSKPLLDKMKGHGYIIFDPRHLTNCHINNAFIVGDALGLAQPMTGEGILPAVLSGKLCATAIINGQPDSYEKLMRRHPTISNYKTLHAIQSLKKRLSSGKENPGEKKTASIADPLIVSVFAYLFSGKSLPGTRLLASLRW